MHRDDLRACLESPERIRPLMTAWGLRDPEGGWHNVQHLSQVLGAEALGELGPHLARLLPRVPDPDMALNGLERFFAQAASRAQMPALLEGRARTLETLVHLLGCSQYFSDLLAQYPDYLDLLRIPLRRSPSPQELRQQLLADVDAAPDDASVLRVFRHFRQRQVLRIGTNDIIRERPLDEVTRDISHVADAAVEVALATAVRTISRRFGEPYTRAGTPARGTVLAFGKLGGEELNYSSDIDLMFLYDDEGSTRGRRTTSIGTDEFYARVVSEVLRLLAQHTEVGQAYRVDLRLRPEGQRGPLARSLASTLSYYDTLGRTWERQALIKVRPVAGDPALGQDFLRAIEPFVYRKYLSFAEINEIRALKRQIEAKTSRAGVSDKEVKTGHGGIRDIEFSIQFLQLLNGGDLPEVRQRNTLLALEALKRVGCLTDQEYHILADAYRFLRKTEHRLQLLFDLQTHRLPDRDEEVRKLALRMGYGGKSGGGLAGVEGTLTAKPESVPHEHRSVPHEHRNAPHETEGGLPEEGEVRREAVADEDSLSPAAAVAAAAAAGASRDGPRMLRMDETVVRAVPPPREPRAAFLHDYREKTRLNRQILNHLLHQAFQTESGAGPADPEADLILDPAPDPELIRTVLERYGFKDVATAYQSLNQLAQESVPFLSTRRCRHFLAAIAPRLLRALSETPDPDMALRNLEKVTESLGAKAVLWELFSFNPPSLKLYVDLCAWSEFLSGILICNPGMIDELLDNLVLNQPRLLLELREELAELCRGAADPDPILHSFRDKELLRIGVRDILGKDSIQATTAALSDLAETILCQITTLQTPGLLKRLGAPYLAEGPRAGQPSRYVLLGLGKLGGRELSYHSDLDLVLIYEGDGRTGPLPSASRFERYELTDNFHFFTELAQRIIKVAGTLGPLGRLYPVDMRLRPTGRSGSLVIPLTEFRRYYQEGGAQLWERQALTRARVVHGDAILAAEVMEVVRQAAFGLPWQPGMADEIAAMRERLESSRSERDVKRGFGGIVDIEFLVQLLQLKYGKTRPIIQLTNTWNALAGLCQAELLCAEECDLLLESYNFLREVESRLRIVHNRSLDELPQTPEGLEMLARRLGFDPGPPATPGQQFLAELERHTGQTRELFLRVVDRERRA